VLNVIGKKIIYEKYDQEVEQQAKTDHPAKPDDMAHQVKPALPTLPNDMVHRLKPDDMVHQVKPALPTLPDDKRIVYYLNDGVYGSFNCIYFDHNVPTILPFNERDGGQYKSTIFGPTCDSIDLICENAMLPDLAIGEWVYVEDFGAYTAAASSAFNGFKTNLFKYIFTS